MSLNTATPAQPVAAFVLFVARWRHEVLKYEVIAEVFGTLTEARDAERRLAAAPIYAGVYGIVEVRPDRLPETL